MRRHALCRRWGAELETTRSARTTTPSHPAAAHRAAWAEGVEAPATWGAMPSLEVAASPRVWVAAAAHPGPRRRHTRRGPGTKYRRENSSRIHPLRADHYYEDQYYFA